MEVGGESQREEDRRHALRRVSDVTDRRAVLRRNSDRHTRTMWRSVAAGYLILLVSAVIGLYMLEHRDTHRLDAVGDASCKRVNVLREQDNDNALVVYGALYSGQQREYSLYKSSTGKAKVVHKKGYEAYKKYASGLRRTGLTDCRQATVHPGSYNAPTPRPFRPSDLK
jgi:hypothetical protein